MDINIRTTEIAHEFDFACASVVRISYSLQRTFANNMKDPVETFGNRCLAVSFTCIWNQDNRESCCYCFRKVCCHQVLSFKRKVIVVIEISERWSKMPSSSKCLYLYSRQRGTSRTSWTSCKELFALDRISDFLICGSSSVLICGFVEQRSERSFQSTCP